MIIVARILGVSFLTGGLGTMLGFVFFGRTSDGNGIALVLGCLGSLVGAIAGVGLEIVTVLRERKWSDLK